MQLSGIPLREQNQNESETMRELEGATVEIRRDRNSRGKRTEQKERGERMGGKREGELSKQYDSMY